MECPRCAGNMIFETFRDMNDDTGRIAFTGFRCILCGEILDPVILSNRRQRPTPLLNRNRKLIVSSKG